MLFVEQFVTPSSLFNSDRINQIFDMAQSYQESPMKDRVGAFQDVKDALDPFLDEVEKHSSIFTKHCIVAPIKTIYDHIQDDFENNDAIKPTTVHISPLDRKYPLSVIGKEVGLKFQAQNQGPGYAFAVQVQCELEEGLSSCDPVNLGDLIQHESREITVKTTVETTIQNPYVMGRVSWRNFDQSEQYDEFDCNLIPQRTDLNWGNLKLLQPYSLAAVARSEDMVGRTILINQLRRKLLTSPVESSIISGEKRVGKTSIAKVVEAEFGNRESHTVILLSIGGLDKTTSERVVRDLGKSIVE